MKRLLIVVLTAFVLLACSSDGGVAPTPKTKTQIVEALTALQATVNLTVQMSSGALSHDFITWKEACRVDQYTRFASALINQAFVTINSDLSAAENLLEAAKNAASGIGDQINMLVKQNCLESAI